MQRIETLSHTSATSGFSPSTRSSISSVSGQSFSRACSSWNSALVETFIQSTTVGSSLVFSMPATHPNICKITPIQCVVMLQPSCALSFMYSGIFICRMKVFFLYCNAERVHSHRAIANANAKFSFDVLRH